MLPSWLFGKSKSKLIEELGGGGGGTSYTAGDGIDISSGVISFDPATTPVIDPSKIDGLDNDLAALTPKTAISNTNILHNPWFQVNQRGFSSGSASGVWPSDRWQIYMGSDTSGTISLTSDGCVKIENTSDGYITFRQRRTNKSFSRVNGRKLTASIMLEDGTIKSGTAVFSSAESVTFISENEFTIKTNPTNNEFFQVVVKPNSTVTIKALKLEIGEISTLAMDTAPDMAIELAKCQRYFQRLSGSENDVLALALCTATKQAAIIVPLQSEMRTTPTMTYSGTFKIAGAANITAITLSTIAKNITSLLLTLSVSVTSGAVVIVSFPANGYIDFSAEL